MTLNPKLSSELQFLIACCQSEPSDLNDIWDSIEEIDDWEGLSVLAHRHGIFPLFYLALKKYTDTIMSSDILEKFKAKNMTIAQNNMLMSAELLKIMSLFKENDIEALAFKGPALAQMAYGDITLRQYADLDILVNKEDIYRIDSILKKKGYQRLMKLTSNQEKIWLMLKHDIGLYNPENGVHIEMHWSLFDEDYPIQMNTSDLWKNSQTVQINQQEIKTFPTEELLLYLCIHGSTHLWERIEWIKDIDMLLSRKSVNWEKTIKIAESSNVETIFYLGIYLAHIFFGTDIPLVISERISNDNRLPTISLYIVQSWQKPQSAFSRTFAMLRLFPDTKARLSYLHKILFKPTLNEYDFVNFPKGMYWVYYFVRPYLLVKKQISRS